MTIPRQGRELDLCEICGSRTTLAFLAKNRRPGPDHLELRRCFSCNHLFVSTPISPDDLAAIYGKLESGDYFSAIRETNADKGRTAVTDLAAWLPRSTLLDIGCGDGTFLELATEEFPDVVATGQELAGQGHPSLDVRIGSVESLSGTWRVVTMLDVLEHVTEPMAFLAAARNLTEDVLYLHTPCRCLWDTIALGSLRLPILRRIGEAWLRTRVSIVHLRLWSEKSLATGLRQAGFRIVSMRRAPEFSHPAQRYAAAMLGTAAQSRSLLAVTTWAISAVMRSRVLRNKVIVMAVPIGSTSLGGP